MTENVYLKISSLDNALFKQLKKIAHSSRERRKQEKTVLDGIHLVRAIADAAIEPESLILREGAEKDEEINQCLVLFPNAKIIELEARLFDQVSPVETPVGILALISIPKPEPKSYQSSVMLENIQDPGNLGSILRTAAASDIKIVYLSKGCAEVWSPKALRSGMGAQFSLDIIEQCELESEVESYKAVVAMSLDSTDSFYDIDLSGSVAFIFGNEGSGITENLLSKATKIVKIPMPGNIESLNVAAAAAICLFERVRQIS